jgi:hypothetical protein
VNRLTCLVPALQNEQTVSWFCRISRRIRAPKHHTSNQYLRSPGLVPGFSCVPFDGGVTEPAFAAVPGMTSNGAPREVV